MEIIRSESVSYLIFPVTPKPIWPPLTISHVTVFLFLLHFCGSPHWSVLHVSHVSHDSTNIQKFQWNRKVVKRVLEPPPHPPRNIWPLAQRRGHCCRSERGWCPPGLGLSSKVFPGLLGSFYWLQHAPAALLFRSGISTCGVGWGKD